VKKRQTIETITEKIFIGQKDITVNLCYLPLPSKMMAKRQRSRRVPFPFCQITLKAEKPLKDRYTKSFYRQRLKNIGAELSRRRLKLGMSQAYLAQKVGVHPETVANWEHSRTIPDVCRLPGIIEFIGYNPLEVTKKPFSV